MKIPLQRALALVALLASCGDPVGVAVTVNAPGDGASDATASSLVGRAWIGAPVRGAKVEVFAYDDLVRGVTFGETITNVDGRFGMPMPEFQGRIVIRISGIAATYRNPLTLANERLGESDELFATVVLGPSLAGRELQVDLLTTLSTSYALSLRNLEGPDRATSLAVERFAQHIHPDVFDATEIPRGGGAALVWPSPEAAVTLFHMGLHEVWTETLAASGMPRPGPVAPETSEALSFVAFGRALRRDIRDGVFDGLEHGQPAWANGPVLDAEPTRARLAEAAKRWNDAQDGWTGLTTAELTAPDGFCTLVSTDVGPLYPSGTPGPGGPYDPLPPSLTFEPPTPAPGAALGADFVVRGRATDPGGLSAIVLTGVTLGTAPTVDLASGIYEVTVPAALNDDGELTLVLSATDRAGNAALIERVVRLDTTPPSLDVNLDGAPDLGPTLLSSVDLSLDGTVSDGGSGVAALFVGPAGGAPVAVPFPLGNYRFDATLTEGPHTFDLEATDLAGNATLRSVSAIVDLSGPTVDVLAPADQELVGPTTFEVLVAAEDPAGPVAVDVRSVGGAWLDAALLDDGRHRVELNSPPSDGAFAFDVRARDAAGHETLQSASAVRDGTPPLISNVEVLGAIASPVPGRYWTAAAEAAVRVHVADANGIASVDVGGVPAAPSGASWSALVPVAGSDLNVTTVTARDPVQNQSQLSLELGRDLAPPTCTLNALPGSGWTAAASLVLDGATTDAGAGVASVVIEGGLSAAPALVIGDAYQGTVQLPASDTELRARCTDALGNSASSAPTPIRVDRTAPLVTISPADGAHLNVNVASVELAVSELSGVARAELRTSGGEYLAATLIEEGSPTKHWHFHLDVPLAELDGLVTVEYRVEDLAGNMTPGKVVYEKDAFAPVFGAVDVVGAVVRDGVHYVREPLATVRVALLDAPSAVGGVRVGDVPATLAGGSYQALVDLMAADASPIPIPLLAWDLAGNERTGAVWIARDTAPPTCQLGPPASGGYTNANELTLAATSEDEGARGVSIRVILGDAVGPATSAPAGSFDVLAGPLPAGSTFVSLLCQDALGNAIASSPVLVHRDLDAPVVSDCTPSTGAVLGAAAFELSCRVDDVDPALTVTAEPQTLGFGPAAAPVSLALSGGRYRAVIPGFGALMTQSGPARLRIGARDRAGSTGDLDLDLAVDLAPPEITTLTATPGVVLPSGEVAVRSGAVAVSVLATDFPAGIAHVRIGHPNAGLPGPSDAAGLQAGAYVAQRNVGEPGGELIVALEDAVGNRADAALDLRVDDTPPACTLKAPSGPTTTAKDHVSLVIDAQDALAGGESAVAFRAGLTAGPQVAGPTASLLVSGLVEGPNELWARCSDALGNSQESAHVVVTRDSLPPVIQILSPAEGAFVPAADGVLVAKVTDAGALGSVSVRRQGTEAAPATDADGTWQATFTTPLQADGEFWVDVLASDAVGNATSKRLTLRRDGTPPVLGSPDVGGAVMVAGVHWVRGPLALIRLPATDLGSGVSTVTIGGKPAALQGGAYEASVAVGVAPMTLAFSATDAAGNTSSGQVVLRADATPPTCELEYPTDQKKWRKVTGLFGVYTRSEDAGVGTEGIDFDVDGVLSTGVPAMLAEGIPFPNIYLGWATLSGPSHHLVAICSDRLGNTQSSPVLELGVDLVPPSIPTVTPASGSFVRSGTFTVSATVTDALSGLAKLKFSNGGTEVTLTGPPFPSPAAATFTIPGGAMTYSVAIYADDYAGNSAFKAASYIVDNAAPTLQTPTTVAGAVLLSGVRWVGATSATLTAVVTDPAGVAQVKFGTLLATLKSTHDGIVTATAKLSDIPVATPKVYEVRATDTLGNVQVLESVTLRADVTPPTCTLTDPLDDHWTSDPALVVRVESTDTGIKQVVVTLDGGTQQDFPAAFQGDAFAAALTLSGEEVDIIQATCTDALGNTAQSNIATVHFDDVPPTIVILPTSTKDYSGTGVNVGASPPTLSGSNLTVDLTESSCTGVLGCPPLSLWTHLATFTPGESLSNSSAPFLAVIVSDNWGILHSTYSTLNSSNGVILNDHPFASASSAGLSLVGVPLVPSFLTEASVITSSKWPTKILLSARDRAGNLFERIIPIQVKLLPSPMRTTVVAGAAAPDLAGLNTAGALSTAFSANPTAPWSTLGGVRVLHVEVENPYNVQLPVTVELAGNVRFTRDIARRLPTTTVLESCVSQTCAVGECRVGTQCAALGSQPSYGRNFSLLTQWRPKSSYAADSPVLPTTDGALLIPAKTKRYLSFVAPTPSTCFVLPAKTFGSKTAYPNPQLGSTCASPLQFSQPSALCPVTTAPCQNLKGDLLELIERVHVEGSHNYGTTAAVLPARVVAAIPGAPAPTVTSTSPGFPLDWSLNVAP